MNKNYLILLLLLLVATACTPAATTDAQTTAMESDALIPDTSTPEENAEVESEHDDENEGDERREHGAHEHGAATLTVAWSGSDMQIELDTPGFNLFGFEYEPTTDEDVQIVDEAVHDLESGELFLINAEAQCHQTAAEITTAWDHEGEQVGEAGHEDTNHEAEEGEVHSDVLTMVNLACDVPEDIQSLDLSPLFERFPNLEDLDAQWVSDTNQGAAEMSPDSTVLSLR